MNNLVKNQQLSVCFFTCGSH